MRYLRLTGLAVLLLSISIIVLAFRGESDEWRRDLLIKVVTFAIDKGHYEPGEINDEFSEKAFDTYINMLDFGKRFLLKEDVEAMEKYKLEIDDAMLNVDFEFFDLSVETLNFRIDEAQEYYRDILAKPFDFEKDEKFEADAEKREFADSKKELKEFWRKSMKYEALTRIYDAQKDQGDLLFAFHLILLSFGWCPSKAMTARKS